VEGTPAGGAGAQTDLSGRSGHGGAGAAGRFRPWPWGQKYPAIAQSWRRNWEQVIPFFAFAPELRTILYTTNAIESLNAQVRKAVRVRGHFPTEEAATKLIWLVLRNVQARWKNPPISWHAAKAQLAIQFEERFLLTD
jgi:putative transposase